MSYLTVILSLLLSFSTFSFAETHGGVLSANAAFKAVSDYAIGRGGSLSRVFGIKKLYRVECDSDLFKIIWGGMNSNGVENADRNGTYVAAEQKGIQPDGVTPAFEVVEINGPHCPTK